MKKVLVAVLAAASLSACSYGGLATTGDKVVVAKNNGFFFGVLNAVFVCKVTDSGLTQCSSNQNP